jgi:hypothetical protein
MVADEGVVAVTGTATLVARQPLALFTVTE